MPKITVDRLPSRAALAVAATLVLGSLAPPALADTRLPAPDVAPGTVVAWGGAADVQDALRPPRGLTDAVAVAASDVPGSYTSLALRSDGTVVGWGLNLHHEADVPAGLDDVVAIDGGAGFSVALRADGSVVAWGDDTSGQTDVPADLGPVTAVSAGGYLAYRGIGIPDAVCGFALAVRPDGTVVRWGTDRDGAGCDELAELEPPAGLSDVVAVAAGSRQALALRSDGTVVAWGPGVPKGLDGTPPSEWTDVVAIAAGSGNSLGLRADGTVLAYGIWGETGPPKAGDVSAVSASRSDLFLNTDTTISEHPRSATGAPAGPGYRAVSAGNGYGLAITDSQQPQHPSGGPVLGSDEIQPSVDSNPPGMAEAFQFTATGDATADTFSVYLDADNAAEVVLVGVYDDVDGEPGTLLTSGSTRDLENGAWNAVPVSPIEVSAGKKYWLAVLGPCSTGPVRFRDLVDGSGGPTRTSAQTDLSVRRGLPGTWETGTTYANAPASAYLG